MSGRKLFLILLTVSCMLFFSIACSTDPLETVVAETEPVTENKPINTEPQFIILTEEELEEKFFPSEDDYETHKQTNFSRRESNAEIQNFQRSRNSNNGQLNRRNSRVSGNRSTDSSEQS